MMSYRDPPYAACGCSSTNPTVFDISLGGLSEYREVDEVQMYAIHNGSVPGLPPLPWLTEERECPHFSTDDSSDGGSGDASGGGSGDGGSDGGGLLLSSNVVYYII